MTYIPDRWVVISVKNGDKTFYRVFGTWLGGYAKGDSWRLNSGITKVIDNLSYYQFLGFSGSEYVCSKDSYGTSAYSASILADMVQRGEEVNVEIKEMPEDTDWVKLFKDQDDEDCDS